MCRNAAAVTVVAVAAAASAAQAKRNWQRMDFSDNFTFRDYGEKKRGCVGTLRVVCTHALTHVYAFSDSCTGPRVTLCATHTSVFVYACLLLLLLLLFIFWLGRDLVRLLPPKALLLVNDDQNCNLPHYVVRCEGLRW